MDKQKHKFAFEPRFRRHAFGWRSQPAIQRIREAVSEIKKVARKNPILAAAGAVVFLEQVSPAIEQVDGSSGAIGTAVNRAIADLAPIIANAPADEKTRDAWLERLWEAHANDGIPYIELLADSWGELCSAKEVASRWADSLEGIVEKAWSTDPSLRGHFHGTSACLSSLLFAGRYQELLDLIEKAPFVWWHYRKYGVRALVALGRNADAIRYAESCNADNPIAVARACEEILFWSGLVDEAYARYAIEANRGASHLATYRAIAKKYSHKKPAEILVDLVESTPGEEGKWFAAAKDAGLFEEAIRLANRTPCDPRTLTRASRDFAEKHSDFAIEAGLAALRWLVEGYGYEITGADVWTAYSSTMRGAEKAGRSGEVRERVRMLVAGEKFGGRFVSKILGRELGLP